jgi:hypothetical protein
LFICTIGYGDTSKVDETLNSSCAFLFLKNYKQPTGGEQGGTNFFIMKKLFLLGCGLLLSVALSAQTITYGYDAAGNRVSRVIYFYETSEEIPPPEEEAEEQEQEAIYEEMLSEMTVKIAPNPTEGLLRVTLENMPKKTLGQIFLYNFNGKLITAQKNVRTSAELNITNQPAGIYVLRIVAGEQQTKWKIIKK